METKGLIIHEFLLAYINARNYYSSYKNYKYSIFFNDIFLAINCDYDLKDEQFFKNLTKILKNFTHFDIFQKKLDRFYLQNTEHCDRWIKINFSLPTDKKYLLDFSLLDNNEAFKVILDKNISLNDICEIFKKIEKIKVEFGLTKFNVDILHLSTSAILKSLDNLYTSLNTISETLNIPKKHLSIKDNYTINLNFKGDETNLASASYNKKKNSFSMDFNLTLENPVIDSSIFLHELTHIVEKLIEKTNSTDFYFLYQDWLNSLTTIKNQNNKISIIPLLENFSKKQPTIDDFINSERVPLELKKIAKQEIDQTIDELIKYSINFLSKFQEKDDYPSLFNFKKYPTVKLISYIEKKLFQWYEKYESSSRTEKQLSDTRLFFKYIAVDLFSIISTNNLIDFELNHFSKSIPEFIAESIKTDLVRHQHNEKNYTTNHQRLEVYWSKKSELLARTMEACFLSKYKEQNLKDAPSHSRDFELFKQLYPNFETDKEIINNAHSWFQKTLDLINQPEKSLKIQP